MSRHLARRPLRSLLAVLAATAMALAACAPSTPALTDPVEILRAGAASLGAMDSFHLRGVVDGDVALDFGGISGGAPLPLNGTTLDGDVDVAAGELAVELFAPALLNLRLNLVVADGSAFLRAPILVGDGWVRAPLDGGFAGDPAAALDGLQVFLARPELVPEKLPDVRCVGTDCYGVRVVVPAGDIRVALGWLGDAIPGLSGDAVGAVTVTAGVRKDTRQLATLGLDVPAGGTEPLRILLELSRVNEPVTIAPPPADETQGAPGG